LADRNIEATVPAVGLVSQRTAVAASSRAAQAEPPAPDLLARMAACGAHFERLQARVSYLVDGRLETLGRDGRVDSVKEMKARVEAEGGRVTLLVEKYTEDGEDKTDEARAKARESAEKRDADKKPIRPPILAEEQPRYIFDQVEVDPSDPTRVRIAFSPKVSAEDTIEGSAWVDTRDGTLISARFGLTKTPMFVDYMHFSIEFGALTPLGPAVSMVFVEGKGGLPFFRKLFRGAATLSEYSVPG
jgi:hypothetical protein